jgi:hypothetical protein
MQSTQNFLITGQSVSDYDDVYMWRRFLALLLNHKYADVCDSSRDVKTEGEREECRQENQVYKSEIILHHS